MEFLEPLFKMLLVNIILSGDNAVVIAMASRNLPEDLQRKSIEWGGLGAIALRIVFTFLMVYLLRMPFVQLIGGLLLFFVAYKLLVDKDGEHKVKSGSSLREAVKIIIFADLIMSLDNVLALASIADNNMFLVVVSIILSVPILLTASQLIMKLMQKYSFIVYAGAAILAWTAGEMLLKEPVIYQYVEAVRTPEIILLTIMTLLVIVSGWKKGRKQNA